MTRNPSNIRAGGHVMSMAAAISMTAAVVTTLPSLCQGAEAQEVTRTVSPLEEIIVTGTVGGVAERKLDASFAISTVSAEEIEQAAPAHSADLLFSIPGVWVEASGGVAGSNVDFRGLPNADGGTRFVTFALNNMPIYHAPMLAFVDQSALFRLDDTIERVEGLRGGPNPVFANGQPGMTANFLLKEGGDTTEGSIKYSTSDYDLQRGDFVISGPVSDKLYYMVGGYITSSPGQGREAGFRSDKGNQFTINLTRLFDNGKINVYHRQTDDHGAWYLPVATDLGNKYQQLGPSNRQALIPLTGPDGQGGSRLTWQSFDLGEGRGWKGSNTGFSATFETENGWSLAERAIYTVGDADTLGMVPQGSPVQLNSLLDVNNNPITSGVTLTGASVAGTDRVQQFGPWVARKQMESFSNDLTISRAWDWAKVSVGQYSASWQSNDAWSLGNQKYYVLKHDGEQLASNGGAGQIPCNAPDVQTCTWAYDIEDVGDATEMSVYGDVQFNVGRFSADIGARHGVQKTDYTLDQGGALDGIIDVRVADVRVSANSYTAGVNWSITDNTGVFARVNSGFAFPNFNEYRTQYASFLAGSDLIMDIDQYEVGYKLATGNYSLYATAFHTELDGQPVCIVGSNSCNRLGTETKGIELDGGVQFGDFAVNLIGTLQDSEIVRSTNPTEVGNQVQRQPKVMLRLTPQYVLDAFSVRWSLYGSVQYVGERYSENENVNRLGSYTKVDAGVATHVSNGLSFRVAVDNLTDEEAITEGDPRDLTAPNGRFILPRTVRFTVGYNF